MVNTEEIIYRKAFKELYEVYNRLSDIEKHKIPDYVLENIITSMDKEYIWEYDDSKGIEEQKFLTETKAMIVEMYERYLCPEDKKDFWKKYDQICFNMVEEQKAKEYDPDNIFKNNKNNKNKKTIKETKDENNINLPAKIKHENVFKKLINRIIKFFRIRKG